MRSGEAPDAKRQSVIPDNSAPRRRAGMTLEATRQDHPAAAVAPGLEKSHRRLRLRRRSAWLGLGALILAILAAGVLAWLRPWADPEALWREGEAALKAGRIDRAEAASNRLERL